MDTVKLKEVQNRGDEIPPIEFSIMTLPMMVRCLAENESKGYRRGFSADDVE